jgi:hypothetical protein
VVDCFVNDPQCFHYTFLNLDAHSGPSGENPVGTGQWGIIQSLATFTISGSVTCVAVSGKVAIVGFTESPGFDRTLVRVSDRGEPDSGQDLFEVVSQGTFSGLGGPPDCSSFPPTGDSDIVVDRSGVNDRGDIRVHDAPAHPTSKDQCKHGGWRDFGVFKNQGDCVSYVATKGRNAPSGG